MELGGIPAEFGCERSPDLDEYVRVIAAHTGFRLVEIKRGSRKGAGDVERGEHARILAFATREYAEDLWK
jgi:hypothetical protein